MTEASDPAPGRSSNNDDSRSTRPMAERHPRLHLRHRWSQAASSSASLPPATWVDGTRSPVSASASPLSSAVMRAATIGGAVRGALACFCVTWWTSDLESPLAHSALPPLGALFTLTFAATRAGRSRSSNAASPNAAAAAPPRRSWQTSASPRSSSHPSAPTWQPPSAVKLSRQRTHPRRRLSRRSRRGHRRHRLLRDRPGLRQRTYMLTTLRRVHRGTDGGVSARSARPPGVSQPLLVVLVGGLVAAPRRGSAGRRLRRRRSLGLLSDSLLGATVERRGWIGNDLVNLSSTAFAAFSLLLLAHARARHSLARSVVALALQPAMQPACTCRSSRNDV